MKMHWRIRRAKITVNRVSNHFSPAIIFFFNASRIPLLCTIEKMSILGGERCWGCCQLFVLLQSCAPSPDMSSSPGMYLPGCSHLSESSTGWVISSLYFVGLLLQVYIIVLKYSKITAVLAAMTQNSAVHSVASSILQWSKMQCFTCM